MFRKFNLYCLFFLGIAGLDAKLEDHFKKAKDKSPIHKMENIDYIYMINLDQRPEKYQKSLDQLLPYGIHPYRFSAVNGWELSAETIDDIGVKYGPGMLGGFMGSCFLSDDRSPTDVEVEYYGQTYFCHGTSRGCIGIVLSHLSVLQDAYDAGYETVWVMEDDIEIIKDPTVIPALIHRLDEEVGGDWDVFFTDLDIRGASGDYVPSYGYAKRPNFFTNDLTRFYDRPVVGEIFRKIGSRFGAHSVIYRRSGMKKILDFMKEHNVYLPYDMEFYLPPGIQMYSVLDDVVGNLPKGLSDNASPGYLNKAK